MHGVAAIKAELAHNIHRVYPTSHCTSSMPIQLSHGTLTLSYILRCIALHFIWRLSLHWTGFILRDVAGNIGLETASLIVWNNSIWYAPSLSRCFCLVTEFIGIRRIILGRPPPIKGWETFVQYVEWHTLNTRDDTIFFFFFLLGLGG